PTITPREVFEASGHVEQFTDMMGRCGSCGAYFKAEGLLPDRPDIGALGEAEAAAALADVRCPDCGKADWSASRFNLMFPTSIGPDASRQAFLRPETAQGIFVNFTALYRLARESVPFGVAQVGRGYRNEISPRQGTIRLREFNMAEIEFFVDPERDGFPPFEGIRDTPVPLAPAEGSPGVMSIGDAFDAGIVRSRYLAYYIARVSGFLVKAGIDPARLRFRQHARDEMAHYASDCWDAEIETSYGWIETVGIADRSAYDLTAHMEYTGRDITAQRRLPEPVERRVRAVEPVMRNLGRAFRGDAAAVAEALRAVPPDEAEGTLTVDADGRTYEVPPECYAVVDAVEKVDVERYVPRVIEPSFGIDRILYSVLEHSYRVEDREGEEFRVLSLPATIAPVKFGVFPLVSKEPIVALARSIEGELRALGLDIAYDEGGSIGRRYARMDELGTPFCITVDHDSLDDGKATVRHRDSREQVRVAVEGIGDRCLNLINQEPRGS
ncbi:MAG: glycine--tRNA ligase, partial [Thermoplasmata archaeon]|nr:glycine--tRNA ligase [Thermoplasmata archaeon]